MKIVIFTGAGISAESGLSTFRDSNGLWENYRIEDVCTHQAWLRNPRLCVDFYNARRRAVLNAEPNEAHLALTRLQQTFPDAEIITQNIDDLHERAGSKHILHLHGEITKLRSSLDESATVPIQGWEQHYGDRHPDGSLLRPHVVFFEEDVVNFPKAREIVSHANIFVIIGTGLTVYPAALLLQYLPYSSAIYVVDPGNPDLGGYAKRVQHVREKATYGVPRLVDMLIQLYGYIPQGKL